MKDTRPLNINPLSIRLPVMAIVSITHRISGFLLFLLIPLALYGLQLSLSSSDGFGELKSLFGNQVVKLMTLALLGSLIFHLLAGLRHLLMDMHIADSLRSARAGAFAVFGLSAIAIFFTAVWIWS